MKSCWRVASLVDDRMVYGIEKSIKLNRSFRALLRGKRGGAFKGERRKEVW